MKTRHCPETLAVGLSGIALFFGGLAPAQAQPHNPNTDWFKQAGYGVFVHYLYDLQNAPGEIQSLGRQTSWDECVGEFDAKAFADQIAQTGAGYVIFTMHQRTRYLIAPNATFDRLTGYQPGQACATRDLVEDLYQALHPKGIKLMLYWTGDGPRQDPRAAKALGWTPKVSEAYVQHWADVVGEYGRRYGEKVAGWWVDGCYRWLDYDEHKLGILAEGLRAGNPQRIIAFNPGVEKRVRAYSHLEDYTCGEQNEFRDLPDGRWIDGEQWHILSFLGSSFQGWGQPGSKYKKSQLIDYVHAVNSLGGVVSIDVLLYRDGLLDRSQREILQALRPGLAAAAARKPVPPGNLASFKPARILSLDGTRSLPVNGGGGPRFAWYGVDGDPATWAQGADQWAWSYQVDLLRAATLGRVVVTFGQGHATELDIMVSPHGQTWNTVKHVAGHDGSKVEAVFDPVPARFVRVAGRKPDGPDQPGGQMSIAELEVYAVP